MTTNIQWELECIAMEDAILQGIKRWLARDEVESVFHRMWLEGFEIDFPYSELAEDVEAFSDSLWEKMDAAMWTARGLGRKTFQSEMWDGAIERLLFERD